jgi:[ribosomal protein S5]-alanine N-acetyltransferase
MSEISRPAVPEQIETERLHLRPMRITDAADIFARYAQDPDVARYVTWRPHQRITETVEFLQRCEQAWALGTAHAWAITQTGDSQVYGSVELRLDGHRAEIGYVLARAEWGQGYMTEAAREVVEMALALPGVYRVAAMCDVENAASARVMEKIGMQREGLLRRYIMHPNVSGEPRDVYLYARVR